MIQEPGFELEFRSRPDGGIRCNGQDYYARRCASLLSAIARQKRDTRTSNCNIDIKKFVPPHWGLGSGTQFALAIARGLASLNDWPETSPTELTHMVQRVSRSSVGTHGFATGGFLIDGGRDVEEHPSEAVQRFEFPAEWRIVLLTPAKATGISGAEEVTAFQNLKPISATSYQHLQSLLYTELAESVAEKEFARFSAAVAEFGELVGEQFAPIQGGRYSSPQAAGIVNQLHAWSIQGVGQSSWGPTIFAFVPDESQAEVLAERCLTHSSSGETFDTCDIRIVNASNSGAAIETR